MEFDLNAPQDSIDKVPEQFRPIFAQNSEGKFALDPKFTGVATAISGFNTSNKTLRTQISELSKKTAVDLSPLSDFGADPATIRAAFDARVAELTAKGGDAAKAVEKVRSEMTAAHQAALAASNERTSRYQSQLHSHMVRSEALGAIAEAKGLPELLMPFIQTQVKVVEADGKFNVVILDDKGEPRYSGLTGQPMTMKELITSMKADPKFGRLFESEQQGGGGGAQNGGRGGARQIQNTNQQEKSPNSKIRDGLSKRFPNLTAR